MGNLHETGEANLLIGAGHFVFDTNYSSYLGYRLKGKGNNQTIIGQYNKSEESLFTVGNGFSTITNTQILRNEDQNSYAEIYFKDLSNDEAYIKIRKTGGSPDIEVDCVVR